MSQWASWRFLPGTGAGEIVLGLGLAWFIVVFIGTMISPRTFGVQDGPTSTVPNDDIDKDVAASGEQSEQDEAPAQGEEKGSEKTTDKVGDEASKKGETGEGSKKSKKKSDQDKSKESKDESESKEDDDEDKDE